MTIPESQKNYLTSLSRPLMGQSRYIVNFSTEWLKPKWRSNARFYLTYASRRLAEAGAFGLPDIYQEGNTFLDFVYEYSLLENGKWTFRFSAENLGDNHFYWTQAGLPQESYYLGRTFSIGTSVSIF